MNASRIIVTSDEIKPFDLFLQMRKTEKSHPKGDLSGLCEKIVIFIEKEDFQQLLTPNKPDVTQI